MKQFDASWLAMCGGLVWLQSACFAGWNGQTLLKPSRGCPHFYPEHPLSPPNTERTPTWSGSTGIYSDCTLLQMCAHCHKARCWESLEIVGGPYGTEVWDSYRTNVGWETSSIWRYASCTWEWEVEKWWLGPKVSSSVSLADAEVIWGWQAWPGTISKKFDGTVRWPWLILKLWSEREWGLPRSLRSIHQETTWMWMKQDCLDCEFTEISADNLVSQPLPVHLQIEDCPPNRGQGRSQTASASLLHSFVIRMVLRSGPFFTLASQSSHGTLGEESKPNMAFTTTTIRLPGWQPSSLKSGS